MSEQENMKIVRTIFDKINSHDLKEIDKYLAEDFRSEASGVSNPMNKEQDRMYLRRYADAFPDLHYDLKDVIAQGDRVAVTWVAKGTHKAPLTMPNGDSIPATQKKATVSGSSFYEMRNNKISRQQIYWDPVDLLTQLGVIKMQDLMSRVTR
jgi:steroid delta-isomerase-like uncharacterized protein